MLKRMWQFWTKFEHNALEIQLLYTVMSATCLCFFIVYFIIKNSIIEKRVIRIIGVSDALEIAFTYYNNKID